MTEILDTVSEMFTSCDRNYLHSETNDFPTKTISVTWANNFGHVYKTFRSLIDVPAHFRQHFREGFRAHLGRHISGTHFAHTSGIFRSHFEPGGTNVTQETWGKNRRAGNLG